MYVRGVRVRACVCVCVCVREREREREIGSGWRQANREGHVFSGPSVILVVWNCVQ